MLKKLRLWVIGPLACVIAFVPLLCINVVQMASVVVWPFSRRAFRAINTTCARIVWTYWAILSERVNGTKVEVVGDDVPVGEDAIVFCNHQGMADILALLCLAWRKQMVGYMKWLVKDVVKYVPGVGWGMLFLDCIFLKRNWADDEKSIKSTFSRVVENRLPLWLVSFPEGTRLTPAKLAASQAFAKKKGMTPTKNVMLPRPKGFAASVIGLRAHVKAVYSVTIRYHEETGGLQGGLYDWVIGRIPRVTIHVKRFPIDALPRDEAALSAWLTQDFQEKDRIFDALA